MHFLQAKMNKQTSLLLDIRRGKEDWTIKVRVTRKWEAININFNNEVILIDKALLDENVRNYFSI